MLPFRWPPVEQDLHLAREVSSYRPEKWAEQDKIAETLCEVFIDGENFVELQGRGCKEQMEHLLLKHRDEDPKSLKRLVD